MRALAREWGRGLGRAVLDLVLPPTCLTCDRPVNGTGELCDACFGQTRFIAKPHCQRCGMPFLPREQANPDDWCGTCVADPPPWRRARGALSYDDQTKRLLLPLKYGDRTEMALALAPLMARAGAELLASADWLVPVPLHRRRLRSRRYNQAALLARELSRLSGRPALLDGLRRVRATAPLATLSLEERVVAMQDAIAVRGSRRLHLHGSRVLLIDDVLTSGATARACIAALAGAGVLEVDVLAAARVRPREGM